MITLAQNTDKDWISSLYEKYKNELNCDFDSAWERYVINKNDYIYVYKGLDESEKGFVHYYQHLDGQKSIREIAVISTSKGIGEKLINSLGEIDNLVVATYKGSKAEKFYKKMGFYEFGEVLDKNNRDMKVFIKEFPV